MRLSGIRLNEFYGSEMCFQIHDRTEVSAK